MDIDKTAKITYQVGKLLCPEKNDPEYDNPNEALRRATELSQDNTDDSLFAVWTRQNHGSELLAIAFRGDIFYGKGILI